MRHKVNGDSDEALYGKTGRVSYLSAEMETQLKNWLLKMCRNGCPLPKERLLYSVEHLLAEKHLENPFRNGMPGQWLYQPSNKTEMVSCYNSRLPSISLGNKWFNNFIDRHAELSYKKSEYLSYARGRVTETFIRNWFRETEELLGDKVNILYQENTNRVWNMDETAIYMKGNDRVIAEKNRPASKVGPNDKENLTILYSVSAAGDVSPPLAVWAYERIPIFIQEKQPPNWDYAKSEKGWMTSAVFYEFIANSFYPYLVEQNIEFPVIVILDGHASHLSIPLSDFCSEHNIIIVCLPGNCTHILQVLDVVFFSPLKKKWRTFLDTYRIKHHCEITKQDIPAAVHKLFEDVNFKESIINGFQCCGMVPFNANRVDYTKLVTSKVVSNVFTQPDEVLKSGLDVLEAEISKNILEQFRLTFTSAVPHSVFYPQKYEGLFEVWSSLFKKVNQIHDPTIVEEVHISSSMDQENMLICDLPDFDLINDGNTFEGVVDDFGNVTSIFSGLADSILTGQIQTTSVAQPLATVEDNDTLVEKVTTPVEKAVTPVEAVTPEENKVSPVGKVTTPFKKAVTSSEAVTLFEGIDASVENAMTPAQSVAPSQNKVRSPARRSSSEPPKKSKTLDEILDKYHHYPLNQLSSKRKNRSVQHMPSVITHGLWRAMKAQKEDEKAKKEAQKVERQMKKIEKEAQKVELEVQKERKRTEKEFKKAEVERERKIVKKVTVYHSAKREK